MSGVKSLSFSAVGLLIILGCVSLNNPRALTAPVNQSLPSDNGQPMQALVNEVRQLRLAIERSNLSAYQAQVTLERIRWQQPRVDRLNEKLEKARAEIAWLRSRLASAPEDLKHIENELRKETDPGKRRELEQALQIIKHQPEELVQLEQQESQLLAQLQPEQARLNELNERLEAAQKELEIGDKPPAGGKR
jgi:peptidoglycan hydrolase CwlO-like protein